MEADMQNRLSQLQGEIHRLESSLVQSPDDAFGYLELGCLFAEADQREASLQAFRQSYQHRTGGVSVPETNLPVVDEQLREAFEVAVAQAPERTRGRTRELFEMAVRQEQRAEAHPAIGYVAGIVLLVMMGLAAFSPAPVPGAAHGYWPSFASQAKFLDVPPATGGYWPNDTKGW